MFEIGNNLREARLRRRIDLMDAEGATKIRTKYLAALETEDFDVLPGPVYARGFLRTYARFLGLNPQLYIDEYNARFGRFEDDDEPVLGRTADSHLDRRSRVSLRTMLIVSLVALAGIAWLGLHDPRHHGQRAHAPATPVNGTTSDFRDRTAAVPQTTPTSASAVGSVAAPTRPTVRLVTARGASWVEVRVGSTAGRVMFSGIIPAGARRTFTASRRLFLTAGAPSVVTLRVPGLTSAKGPFKPVVRGTGSQRTTWIITATGIRNAAA